MQEGRDLINERLDRCVANLTWFDLFPNIKVTHGFVAYSDRVSLLLAINGNEKTLHREIKPFRFEVMWMGSEGCLNITQ